MTLGGGIFCGALPLCPHPLDYSRLGRDQPLEQIVNYDVYCGAHSRHGGPGGEEGEDGGAPLPPDLVLSSPALLHSSFRLICRLVCMTPATEANRDNHFPRGFPLRDAGDGGFFNIGLDTPEEREAEERRGMC